MNESQVLVSNQDVLLFAIPFILILFVSVFRLDQLLAVSKKPSRSRRVACGTDESGMPILSDPDGTLSKGKNLGLASRASIRRFRPI